MFRRTLIIGSILVASTATTATAQVTDTTGTVASWNIEGFSPITNATKIDRLARGLAVLDAEVIGIQEVNPASVAQDIVTRANQQYGTDYAAPVIPAQTADLKLAILHKNGVVVQNEGLIPGSDLNNPNARMALFATVKIGKFDFTLIVVHLKSGRSNASRVMRTAQNNIIQQFISQSTAGPGENDVIILGDYNMILDTDYENFRALNPNGYLRFVSNTQSLRDATNVNGNFLDGYAVTRRRMTEYLDGSFRVYPLHRVFKRTVGWFGNNVSDHFPLVARFDITTDRD